MLDEGHTYTCAAFEYTRWTLLVVRLSDVENVTPILLDRMCGRFYKNLTVSKTMRRPVTVIDDRDRHR